jgi:hypothetical protein
VPERPRPPACWPGVGASPTCTRVRPRGQNSPQRRCRRLLRLSEAAVRPTLAHPSVCAVTTEYSLFGVGGGRGRFGDLSPSPRRYENEPGSPPERYTAAKRAFSSGRANARRVTRSRRRGPSRRLRLRPPSSSFASQSTPRESRSGCPREHGFAGCRAPWLPREMQHQSGEQETQWTC